jgi:Uma2 family endonuclease
MSDPEPLEDLFPFGFRTRRSPGPNGEPVGEWIPLTADDLLDPQMGDEIPQTQAHSTSLLRLFYFLSWYYEHREDVTVTFDMKMFWGIPGLKEPSPDIAVIPGARKIGSRESFDVVKEGVRPGLIIEVVSDLASELRRHEYVDKVEIYQQVGIPEYLILDPPTDFTQGLWTGYRLGPDGRYRRIEPDREGRLLSETTGLLFGVDMDGKTLLFCDARTGERLIDPHERLRRDDQARKAAEERAIQEAEARRAAEEHLRLEIEQRKAAEAELARLRAELEWLQAR